MKETANKILSSRQKSILEVCIKFFTIHKKPIASQHITKHLSTKVSSATIRNELSYLTELGFFSQAFSSSGRIPKTKAYRFVFNQNKNKKKSPILNLNILKSNWQFCQTPVKEKQNQLLTAIHKQSSFCSFLISSNNSNNYDCIHLKKINPYYVGIYLFDKHKKLIKHDYVKAVTHDLTKIESLWQSWLINKTQIVPTSQNFQDMLIHKQIQSLFEDANKTKIVFKGLESLTKHLTVLRYLLSAKTKFGNYIKKLAKNAQFEYIGTEHPEKVFESTGMVFSYSNKNIIGLIGDMEMNYTFNKQLIDEAAHLFQSSQQTMLNMIKPIELKEYYNARK